jgi:hypothetical protein
MAERGTYHVDPGGGDEGSDDDPLQHGHGARIERHGPADPLPLEGESAQPAEETTPEPASIKALDVCPNCGANMPGTGTLVCMRCGYNLKTLKVEMTKTGVKEPAEAEEEEKEKPEALASPGQGNLRLPAALAAGGGALLAIGYLAGLSSLYAAETPGALGRLGALMSEVVVIATLTGCGMGALLLLARYSLEAEIGDLRLSVTRLLGIVVVARLAAFLSMPVFSLEFTIEAAVVAVAYTGLLMYFFVLSARDAALGMVLTLFLFLILLGVSAALYWAVL